MAIFELQFREQAFCDLLQRQVNGRRLPSATLQLGQPAVDNKLLDSITAVGCELVVLAGGELTARLDLLIRYYDSYAVAQAAGNLQQPATQEATQRIPIRLTVAISQTSNGAALVYSSPFGFFKGGQIELGDLAGFPAQTGAIVLEEGVVAIRLGSEPSDRMDSPVVSHIVAGTDWALMKPGALIADTFVQGLHDAVEDLLKTSADYERGAAASGTYLTAQLQGLPRPPLVFATAEVVAVGKCPPFGFDVTVDLGLVAIFATNGPKIVTTLTLSWSADSTWCQVFNFYYVTPIISIIIAERIANAVDKAVLGSAGPAKFAEIKRDDHSITYQQERLFSAPGALDVTSSQFTDEGLVIGGVLGPPRRGAFGLQGWREPAVSDIAVDCSARSVSVKFNPAVVGLFDYNPPGGPPALFPQWTRFVPPNAWIVVPGKSNSWLDLYLTFADPPSGRLPPGTATSVFLMTDCGLRWVDLGVIPADHRAPTTADIAQMFSLCMAKSAGWKERVLSVKWLPRPPGDARGIPPVRQWMIGLQDMPRATRLEFVAVTEGGRERVVGVIENRSNVAVQITTDAHETLEIRSNHDDNLTPVVAAQRWISPFASLKLDGETVAIAAASRLLSLRGGDGTTRLVDLGVDGKLRTRPLDGSGHATRSLELLRKAVSREQRGDRQAWNSAARLDARTVAIVHNGSLLIGTVGELQTL